jgi:hypothetical protein
MILHVSQHVPCDMLLGALRDNCDVQIGSACLLAGKVSRTLEMREYYISKLFDFIKRFKLKIMPFTRQS